MPSTTTNCNFAASLEEAAQESPRRPSAQAVLAVRTDSRYAKRPQHAAVGRSYSFRSAIELSAGWQAYFL